MFTIYDHDCPVCRATKQLKVRRFEDHPDLGKIEHISTVSWGYAPLENELITECFCPGCGIKFITSI